MKTLKVPNQSISNYETLSERMKYLHEAGAEAVIGEVNWKEQFPKFLSVSVHVAHDGNRLFLLYVVKSEQLRAANAQDFGSVWKDSCVEFFMQREGDKTYRNFECNVLGALLAALRENRDNAERLTQHMANIVRFSTVAHRYENGKQVSDWTLYLEIPKDALGFSSDESLHGQKLKANFYKCGDETPEPHYLSWNPIPLPAPNFHVPQYFGLLELE